MMKFTKKLLAGAMAILMCLSCTSCGSSVTSNTKIYFSQVSAVLGNLFAKQDKPEGGNTQSGTTGTPLAAPQDFQVGADGSYSFTGSEGAEYYLLYFCAPDATSDNDSFLYSSSPINEDGSGTYTGQCSDLFDYAYGEYLVKVFAFPDITSEDYSMSTAASASYTYSGKQNAPKIAYYWNTFDGTMGVQVANLDEYLYQAYPDQVDVTFTNVEDSADTVTISVEGVSPENFSAQTDKLTRGAAYRVTAVAASGSAYVTNPTSDTATVADALLLGDHHQFTDGYSYSDGFSDNNYNWPVLCESFDLSNGGTAGTAPSRKGTLTLDLKPQPATDDAAYSYTMEVDGRFPLTGTAQLYADGTFQMEETGGGPISISTIQGTWTDNGDGTAVLSYDHSTVTK